MSKRRALLPDVLVVGVGNAALVRVEQLNQPIKA